MSIRLCEAAGVVPFQLAERSLFRMPLPEPSLQRGYEDLAAHYDTAVLPARPAKPRDKAKVEVAVQVVQRWIVARLRHETHFSLSSLNARIQELLVALNARRMRRYGRSRREHHVRNLIAGAAADEHGGCG